MVSRIYADRHLGEFALIFIGVLATLASIWMIVHGSPDLTLFTALVIPAALMIISNPRTALVLIILGAFSLEYLAGQKALPVMAVWTIDGLTVLLFSRMLLLKGQGTGWARGNKVFPLLLIWAALVVLSAANNVSSPLQIIIGTRAYFRFALLYFCLLEFEWSEKFLKTCLRLVLLLFFLQIPVAVWQMIAGWGIDRVAGTLDSTGTISLLAVVFFAASIAYASFSKRKRVIFIGLLFLALPVLATARAFIFIIPMVGLYLFFKLGRQQTLFQLLVILAGSAWILANWTLPGAGVLNSDLKAVDLLKNPFEFLVELQMEPVEGTTGASVGRLAGLQLAWERVAQSPQTLLFGFGPAVAQGSRFASLQSGLFESLALSGGRASQLARSLLEWGLLGTLAYTIIIIILWRKTESFYRQVQEPFWKAAALGHALLSVLMIILVTYTATWSATSTAFVFWFTGGVLHRVAAVRMCEAEACSQAMEER